MPTRRTILIGATATVAVAASGGAAWWRLAAAGAAPGDFPVSLTEAQWRERLTGTEYAVLREAATEEPYSSPLDAVYDPGTYACVGCDNSVYSSEHKFDSGTGWPSFTQAMAGDVVGLRPDPKMLGLATEAHCARCGGHLGHVFGDGPEPTGLRHCINGVALDFKAA